MYPVGYFPVTLKESWINHFGHSGIQYRQFMICSTQKVFHNKTPPELFCNSKTPGEDKSFPNNQGEQDQGPHPIFPYRFLHLYCIPLPIQGAPTPTCPSLHTTWRNKEKLDWRGNKRLTLQRI